MPGHFPYSNWVRELAHLNKANGSALAIRDYPWEKKNMAVARKMLQFMEKASWIRKMFEEGTRLKKIHGDENVFDFSLGNPNVPPPELVKNKLLKIVQQDLPGKTKTRFR